jgi:hypothetical protein
MIGSLPDSSTPRSSSSARAGCRAHIASATANDPRLPCPMTARSTSSSSMTPVGTAATT